jgi:hypothetical protein
MNRKDLEGAGIGPHFLNVTNTGHKIQLIHSDYVLKLLRIFAADLRYIISPVSLTFIAYYRVSQHFVNIFSRLCASEIENIYNATSMCYKSVNS